MWVVCGGQTLNLWSLILTPGGQYQNQMAIVLVGVETKYWQSHLSISLIKEIFNDLISVSLNLFAPWEGGGWGGSYNLKKG